MQRSITAAVLAASLVVPICTAALAAETPNRYRVAPQPSNSVEVSVTQSGSTWFMGTDTGGKKVTVVFLPRFATVQRDGERVPVSALRPGDRVEVSGQGTGNRLFASSARVTQPRTAAAR